MTTMRDGYLNQRARTRATEEPRASARAAFRSQERRLIAHGHLDRSRFGSRLTRLMVVLVTVWAGCDGPIISGGRDWRQPASRGKERWTICCVRHTAADLADYAERCNELADMLRRVDGLRPKDVRVVTDATSSTIYYGQYVKVPSPETGTLRFPPEMRRDIGLIRRQLTPNRYAPFARAVPELIEQRASTVPEEWHVTRAKGRYTLQVAVFYNTPTFSERRQAAEDYVRLLRERGLAAYYTHEPARSFVFVGDFEVSDVVQTEQGPRYGPRVQRLVAQNNVEFKYVTENLHIVKHRGLDGQMTTPPSFLIESPRAAYAIPWRP